jgi:hypothetical protein
VHAEAHRCWCASRARSGPIEDRHCTRYGERGPGGTVTHAFRFLGRKVQAADTNGTVLDASMTVLCVHRN